MPEVTRDELIRRRSVLAMPALPPHAEKAHSGREAGKSAAASCVHDHLNNRGTPSGQRLQNLWILVVALFPVSGGVVEATNASCLGPHLRVSSAASQATFEKAAYWFTEGARGLKLEEITTGASLEGVEPSEASVEAPTVLRPWCFDGETVGDDEMEGPLYLKRPFVAEPGWGVPSINFEIKALMARAEKVG